MNNNLPCLIWICFFSFLQVLVNNKATFFHAIGKIIKDFNFGTRTQKIKIKHETVQSECKENNKTNVEKYF